METKRMGVKGEDFEKVCDFGEYTLLVNKWSQGQPLTSYVNPIRFAGTNIFVIHLIFAFPCVFFGFLKKLQLKIISKNLQKFNNKRLHLNTTFLYTA